MKKLFVLTSLLVLSGCSGSGSNEPTRDVKYDHVVRIFMHEVGYYTVFTQAPGSTELVVLHFTMSGKDRKFIADVPVGQPMWVREKQDGWASNTKYEFHIHSPKDIEGGGWNHGKGGRGQTQVIE